MFSSIMVFGWGNLCNLKYIRLWPHSFICTFMLFWNLSLYLNVALSSCPHTADVGLCHSGRDSEASLKVSLLLSSILPFFCTICTISFNHLFHLPYWSPLLNMYHIHYNIFVLEFAASLFITKVIVFLGLYISWIFRSSAFTKLLSPWCCPTILAQLSTCVSLW